MRASSQLSKECAYLAEVTRGIQSVPFRIFAAFFVNVRANVERKGIQGNEATPLDTTVYMTAQLSSCIWNEHPFSADKGSFGFHLHHLTSWRTLGMFPDLPHLLICRNGGLKPSLWAVVRNH